MIAVLFAFDSSKINYNFGAGFSGIFLGCITVLIVYKVDTILNKKMVKLSKSIFLFNFLFSFLISALFLFSTSWLLSGLIKKQWTLDFSFLREQIIILNFLLIIILSYLTISYFTRSIVVKNKKLEADNLEMSTTLNKYLSRIPAAQNKKTLLIPISQIAYFKIEDGLIFGFTKDHKRHSLTLTTLNELEAQLNPARFFRINRSEIVNIDEVASYEPYFKDRLAIKLVNLDTILYTSNTKSPPFKGWLLSPTV